MPANINIFYNHDNGNFYEYPAEIQINKPDLKSKLSIYPNPFQTSAIIQFHLNKPSNVILSVYNLQGKKIKQILDNDIVSDGRHEVYWDGNYENGLSCNSGYYFVNFKINKNKSQTFKIFKN